MRCRIRGISSGGVGASVRQSIVAYTGIGSANFWGAQKCGIAGWDLTVGCPVDQTANEPRGNRNSEYRARLLSDWRRSR